MLQNLPELILDLVCCYLTYEDVLTLRSVCRDLKSYVDGKQFTKLNLFVGKFSCYHRLFCTGDWICHAYSYHSKDLTILNSNRFREQFRYVQKMIICNKIFYRRYRRYRDEDATAFDLASLNCFEALTYLEMNEMPALEGKLNLPELQVAAFQTDFRVLGYKDCSFELKCPKLKVLKILVCKPVLTCETNRLEYLYYDYFDCLDSTDYLKSISPNLRKLSTICLESSNFLLKLLSDIQSRSLDLSSLSQIELKQSPRLGKLDELAKSLRDLKQDARTKHIKFIFIGKLINSLDELSRIPNLILALIPEHERENDSVTLTDLDEVSDRLPLFLNGTPELEFLLSATRRVDLYEDMEWTEEVIKKLKSVDLLIISRLCKPSVSTLVLFAKNCKSLDKLHLTHQTVTEQMLEMLSDHLLNLTWIIIHECRYETLKPLAKFRNLEVVDLDFNPPKDELTFIYENSRTLEQILIYGEHHLQLLRTTTRSKWYRITITRRFNSPLLKFDTLSSMIAYYYGNLLIREYKEASTRLI